MTKPISLPAARDGVGFRCGACGQREFRVLYTRAAKGGKVVRRRECCRCGTRITTWEQQVNS